MSIHEQVWGRAELADGLRLIEVLVRFDRLRASDYDDDDRASGVLSADSDLPIGKALNLRLADGRRALIVVVDRRGRFLASGPLWRSR
jgi:hypothetical protein